jgi:hypothetical protein
MQTPKRQPSRAVEDVLEERNRQQSLMFGGKPASEFDKTNSQADWITYIMRYGSCGAPKLENRKDMDFRKSMVRTAALAIAAIASFDSGYAQA